MPYIVKLNQADTSALGVSHIGQAVARAGERLGQGLSELHAAKLQAEKDKRDADAENRRLDIAETNAKRQLLAEVNRAKALGAREDAKAAAMEGAVGEFQGAQAANEKQAFGGGLQEGLRSSGGVLGPFGMLNPRALAQGGKAMMESAARVKGKTELAMRMEPGAAGPYLRRVADEEHKLIQAQGYQREKEALEDAVLEGRVSPEEAKPLVAELQEAIATGKDPGQVEQRISKAYDLHAKMLTRSQDWEEADTTAAGMLDSLRQMAASVPDGVDPNTGVSLKQEIAKRLGEAKVEWNRTKEGPTGANQFRLKTDPQASLAGLQKILFEAQAGTEKGAGAFIEADAQEARDAEMARKYPTPSRREVIQGAGRANQRGGVPQNPQGLQEAPGARQAQAAPAVPPKAGSLGAKAEKQRTQLQAVVRDGAQAALRSGSKEERKTAMKALLQRVADDLGLDASSPEVLAAVREELSRSMSGGR